MKCLKTIRSYTGVAQWLTEVSKQPHAWLALSEINQIASPYAYSPTRGIYIWKGKEVIGIETAHRKFQVFEVPAAMVSYATDAEATDAYIATLKT